MGLKDSLTRSLSSAADKGTELAGKAKVKLEITTKKNTIKDRYRQLGQAVHEARKAETDIEEEIQAIGDEIDLLLEEIRILEESL